MKVYLHTCDPGESEKENTQKLELGRVPVVGEYIVTSNSSTWYKVVLVLHTAYVGADAEAEVWGGVKIMRLAAIKASGYNVS